MTYAELFARVGALVPDTHSYAIEVQTFMHVHTDGSREVRTQWRISVLPRDNSCVQAFCRTPEEALAEIGAKLGNVDKTGIGELVGNADVEIDRIEQGAVERVRDRSEG